MSRTGQIVTPCRAGAAFALALLLAACPSGVVLKRGGPCGQLLCECPVSAQAASAPDTEAHPCCHLQLQAAQMNFEAPAASNAAARWAFQEAFAQCTPGTLAECALLGADADIAAAGAFDRARPEPPHEIPTPPPRS